MDFAEIDRFLGKSFFNHGFAVAEVNDFVDYGGRPAGAVFYVASDCKLQICWSIREGSVDFLLSQTDAPNEFGLLNRSGKWYSMLMLDDSHDGLVTPSIQSDAEIWWEWRNALFNSHVEAARKAVIQT